MLNRPRNTCIIINDALYQDLCMFVFFIIMTHHMHLRLCSNFRKQRRLITVLPDLPYYPGLAPKDFLLFLKLDEFLSGHRYKSRQASFIHSAYPDVFQKWIQRLKLLHVMSNRKKMRFHTLHITYRKTLYIYIMPNKGNEFRVHLFRNLNKSV